MGQRAFRTNKLVVLRHYIKSNTAFWGKEKKKKSEKTPNQPNKKKKTSFQKLIDSYNNKELIV